jgi:hypothetical protein
LNYLLFKRNTKVVIFLINFVVESVKER